MFSHIKIPLLLSSFWLKRPFNLRFRELPCILIASALSSWSTFLSSRCSSLRSREIMYSLERKFGYFIHSAVTRHKNQSFRSNRNISNLITCTLCNHEIFHHWQNSERQDFPSYLDVSTLVENDWGIQQTDEVEIHYSSWSWK